MDPDLLLEPEKLGIQMIIPTNGKYVYFQSGLKIKREGNSENPIELEDRQQNEREKKIQ